MRIARKAAALALLGLLGLGGCGTYGHTTTANAQRGPNANRDPGGITVTEATPDRRYQPLGQIRTTVRPINLFSSDPTRADVDAELRREAARFGADAVVNVRYDSDPANERGLRLARGGLINATGDAVMWLP